jgi:hypothetical protein
MTEVSFEIDNYSVDFEKYLVPHPVWHLDKVDKTKASDTRVYEMYNVDIESDDSLSKVYLSKQSSIIRFDLIIKRNPLFIMINGVVPSFILNLVILLAFSLSFDTQIGLCKLNSNYLFRFI